MIRITSRIPNCAKGQLSHATGTLNTSSIRQHAIKPPLSLTLPKRTVYIYSKPKHRRKTTNRFDLNLDIVDRKKQSIDLISDDDSDRVIAEKLKKLQRLTHDLQKEVKNGKLDKIHQTLAKPQNQYSPSGLISEERDIEHIYKHLAEPSVDKKSKKSGQNKNLLDAAAPGSSSIDTNGKGTSLFDMLSQGPKINSIIAEKLGDSIRHISSKFNANWEALLDETYQKNPTIFHDIPLRQVEDFIALIPVDARAKKLSVLNELLFESKLKPTRYIYDLYLQSLASQLEVNMVQVDSFYKQLLADGLVPSVHTYGNYVKAVSKSSKHFIRNKSNTLAFKQIQSFKNHQLERINQTLADMKQFKLKPNLVVYTNILQSCIILEDFKQARDIFDMCKFHNFKLDAKIYNSILLIEAKQNNMERSLDLYQEMLDAAVRPNAETYLVLAQACALDDRYLLRAWEFLLMYLQEHSESTLSKKIVETMMLLASKDSDLMLARILFLQVFKKFLSKGQDPGPEFLNLLFETYKNYDPRVHAAKVPVMLSNDKTKSLRYNLINSINFQNLYLNNMADKMDENVITDKADYELPPMLPLYQISTSKQILEESRAIWTYMLFNFPQYINVYNVSSYLKVAVYHGESIEDFATKFDELTYFDDEGIDFRKYHKKNDDSTEQQQEPKITIEEDYFQDEKSVEAPPGNHADTAASQSSPSAVPDVINIASTRQKALQIPRTNALYKLALVAARKHKSFPHMQHVWVERGKFRKTAAFTNLGALAKRRLDFEFAREMVAALVAVGLVHDAVNIVLSTEKQFEWTFYYLKRLYVYAESVGDEVSKRKISQVAQKHRGVDSQLFRVYNARKHG